MESNNVNSSYDVSKNSSRRNSEKRRVSFPDTQLVTYAEPRDPLILARNATVDQILRSYLMSCETYNTDPLQQILKQVSKFDLTDNIRQDELEIRDTTITAPICDTLEEIFRRVQFIEVILLNCVLEDDAAESFFDMMEYYESTMKLKLFIHMNPDCRGWEGLKRYIIKSEYLEDIEMFNMDFKENDFKPIAHALGSDARLESLKIKNSSFENLFYSLSSLGGKLQDNYNLRELHLPNNGLTENDGALLGHLIINNHSLYILDVSNNNIKNRGAKYIINALVDKRADDRKLVVLILWNTGLTDKIATTFKFLFTQNYKLEILNIGQNKINDFGFTCMEDGLKNSNSVIRLGVQNCQLTDYSCASATRILLANNTLEQIDFRGNHITLNGVQAFLSGLSPFSGLLRADFDTVPSDNNEVTLYKSVLADITKICESNKLEKESEEQRKRKASRKISLTCPTLNIQRTPPASPVRINTGKLRSPDLSPVPSPSSSAEPAVTKSRFQITLVKEVQSGQKTAKSRFTVYHVQESPNKKTIGFDVPTTSAQDTPPASSNGFTQKVNDDPRPESLALLEEILVTGKGDQECCSVMSVDDEESVGMEVNIIDHHQDATMSDEESGSNLIGQYETTKQGDITFVSNVVETNTAKDSEEISIKNDSVSILSTNIESESLYSKTKKSAFLNIHEDLTDNCMGHDIGTTKNDIFVIVSDLKENDVGSVKLNHLLDDGVDLRNNNKLECNPNN